MLIAANFRRIKVSPEEVTQMKMLITVLYILIIGQVGFFFGLSLPRSCFDETSFPYRQFKWEKHTKLYEKLRVKKWKTKVLDMSTITKRIFPKKIHENITARDVDRLVKESCIAEMVHYVLCLFSIGLYNIWRGKLGVFFVAVYIFGNLPYVVIQRYNRPNYISLRDKLILREEKRANAKI